MNRNLSLARRVHILVRDMLDFKQKQFSGAGNVVSYASGSGDTWDINETASTTGTMWFGRFGTLTCTFTADRQPAAFTTFEVTCLVDDVPFYLSASTQYIVYTGFQDQTTGDVNVAKYQNTIVINWGVNTGVNIKIKVRAVSVDTGELTIDKVFNGA